MGEILAKFHNSPHQTSTNEFFAQFFIRWKCDWKLPISSRRKFCFFLFFCIISYLYLFMLPYSHYSLKDYGSDSQYLHTLSLIFLFCIVRMVRKGIFDGFFYRKIVGKLIRKIQFISIMTFLLFFSYFWEGK